MAASLVLALCCGEVRHRPKEICGVQMAAAFLAFSGLLCFCCSALGRVKSALKMMVSDLNHLPGRVKRSDLVQSGRDTSPDVVGGLTRAQE